MSQALHFSDCPLATSAQQRTNNSCPEGYDFYDGMCYMVSVIHSLSQRLLSNMK